MSAPDPTPPDRRRFSIRLPRPRWIVVVAGALVIAVGLRFGLKGRLSPTPLRQSEQTQLDRTFSVVGGGELTDEDIRQIKTLVSLFTNDSILQITIKRPDMVEVMTGVIRGPLDGGGEFFDFEKRDGTWVRINEAGFKSWVS